MDVPMSIWVTEMSNWRPSMALDFVRPDTACLEHAYAADCGRGTWAASEPLLMTLPVGGNASPSQPEIWSLVSDQRVCLPPVGVCDLKILNASRVQRNDPTRFTFKTEVKSSSGISSIGCGLSDLPAFFASQSAKERKKDVRLLGETARTLNNKSSLPNRSIVRSKRRLTNASSVMSPSTRRHSSGSTQAAFVSWSSGRRRAVSARRHPAAESAIAVCFPMPRCNVYVCISHSALRVSSRLHSPTPVTLDTRGTYRMKRR